MPSLIFMRHSSFSSIRFAKLCNRDRFDTFKSFSISPMLLCSSLRLSKPATWAICAPELSAACPEFNVPNEFSCAETNEKQFETVGKGLLKR